MQLTPATDALISALLSATWAPKGLRGQWEANLVLPTSHIHFCLGSIQIVCVAMLGHLSGPGAGNSWYDVLPLLLPSKDPAFHF